MNSQSRGMDAFQDDVLQTRDYPGPLFACEAKDRTFPAPWSVDQIPHGCRVLDANQRVLAYVVTGEQSMKEQSGGLSLEEAWRIAGVISSLPELITGPPPGRTKRPWFWRSMRRSNRERI